MPVLGDMWLSEINMLSTECGNAELVWEGGLLVWGRGVVSYNVIASWVATSWEEMAMRWGGLS